MNELKEIFDTKLYFDITDEDYIKIQNYINNLQSKIDKAIDKLNQYEIISGYYDSNYDDIEDTYSHDIKEDLLDILKEVE